MASPLCCSKDRTDILLSLELVFSGIVFGLFNNASTIFNVKLLYERDFKLASGLSIFFLVFPGLVTSVGFFVFHCLGHKKAGRVPPLSKFLYFFVLLLFYPVLTVFM